jgi:hypothetical protein
MKNLRLEDVNHHNAAVFVKNFINHIPKRLDLAIALEFDERTKSCCNDMDYIDFHYRRYLSNQDANLKRVFFEIRRFLDNGHLPEPIYVYISDMKELILNQEFYELVPRLESSSAKINKLIDSHESNKLK